MSLPVAIAVLLQSVSPAATPTPAPTATPTPSSAVAVGLPLCLSRPVTGGTAGSRFDVVVTSALSTTLLTKGFSVIPCATSYWTAAKYRDEVCRLAKGNTAVQARLETFIGVKPTLLCETAAVLGTSVDSVLTRAN